MRIYLKHKDSINDQYLNSNKARVAYKNKEDLHVNERQDYLAWPGSRTMVYCLADPVAMFHAHKCLV